MVRGVAQGEMFDPHWGVVGVVVGGAGKGGYLAPPFLVPHPLGVHCPVMRSPQGEGSWRVLRWQEVDPVWSWWEAAEEGGEGERRRGEGEKGQGERRGEGGREGGREGGCEGKGERRYYY